MAPAQQRGCDTEQGPPDKFPTTTIKWTYFQVKTIQIQVNDS